MKCTRDGFLSAGSLLASLLYPLTQLGTKHMAPPGGATSNRLDSPVSYCLVSYWWRRLEVLCVSYPLKHWMWRWELFLTKQKNTTENDRSILVFYSVNDSLNEFRVSEFKVPKIERQKKSLPEKTSKWNICCPHMAKLTRIKSNNQSLKRTNLKGRVRLSASGAIKGSKVPPPSESIQPGEIALKSFLLGVLKTFFFCSCFLPLSFSGILIFGKRILASKLVSTVFYSTRTSELYILDKACARGAGKDGDRGLA